MRSRPFREGKACTERENRELSRREASLVLSQACFSVWFLFDRYSWLCPARAVPGCLCITTCGQQKKLQGEAGFMHNTAAPSVSFRLEFEGWRRNHSSSKKKKKNLHGASQFTEHFLFHSCSWSSHLFWAVLGGVCFFSLSH